MLSKLNLLIMKARKSKDSYTITKLSYLKSLLEENSKSNNPINDIDVIVKYRKKLVRSMKKFPVLINDIENELVLIDQVLELD